MNAMLKIGIAAVTIFAIGFVIVTLEPKGASVAEADADIASWNFASDSHQRNFLDAVKKIGFEKPRKYNWNGNDYWFSTVETPEVPAEALKRIETILKEEGVNGADLQPIWDEALTDQNVAKQIAFRAPRVTQMLSGGMSTVASSEEHFTLVGNSTAGEHETHAELLGEFRDALASGDPTSMMNQGRYIDGRRTKNGTRLTALWSGKGTQPGRIVNRGEGLNTDTSVPICPGCNRLSRIVGDEPMMENTTIDAGFREPRELYRFYHTAFVQRGWSISDSTALLEARRLKVGQRDQLLASYQREGGMLTLVIFRNDDGNTIVTVNK